MALKFWNRKLKDIPWGKAFTPSGMRNGMNAYREAYYAKYIQSNSVMPLVHFIGAGTAFGMTCEGIMRGEYHRVSKYQ